MSRGGRTEGEVGGTDFVCSRHGKGDDEEIPEGNSGDLGKGLSNTGTIAP